LAGRQKFNRENTVVFRFPSFRLHLPCLECKHSCQLGRRLIDLSSGKNNIHLLLSEHLRTPNTLGTAAAGTNILLSSS
jgi:hypothetical protein